MKQLQVGLMILSAIATGSTAASATVSGSYLVTFHDQHPADSFYEPLCVKIVEDGSTLRFKTSGTVILNFNPSDRPVGQWFATKSRGAVFSVAFADQGGPSVLTFSGEFGKPQITGTSFVLFTNGADVAGGTFTAVKGACSF